MKSLIESIDQAIASDRLAWRREDTAITVGLWHGHQQRVHLEKHGDHYRFWSVVAGSAQVTASDSGWRSLAYRAWRKNDLKELVAFSFDREDRLIGVIEQPAATLDRQELVLYINVLATECDRFEYQLSGQDRW